MSKRKSSKSTKVVLRGDIVKDDSGNCNVFAEARCFSVTYDGGGSLRRYFKITHLFWTNM